MPSHAPHVTVIFGTRPEFIKLVPLIHELNKRSLRTTICNTGQHQELLTTMLDAFDIQPHHHFNLMRENQSLTQISAGILNKFDLFFHKEKPDMVLVQGDTTTAFMAGLASFYHRIKIGHVEAGLRTHDKYNPFPEEINRRLVSVMTDYHFAPTETARKNLVREGIPDERIYMTGNTVVDALRGALTLIQSGKVSLNEELIKIIAEKPGPRIIPITIHRRESFGTPLENMCRALRTLAFRYPHDLFIYPVHLNPNVQKPVYSLLGGIDNLYLINPLDYFSFIYLLDKAYLVLTDSGGIQEEASSLGKPVLVLRDKTERSEGVESGVLKIIGTQYEKIINEVSSTLDSEEQYAKMLIQENLYGNGKAAKNIADIIVEKIFKIL